MYLQIKNLPIHFIFVFLLIAGLSACGGSSVRHAAKVAIIPGEAVDLNETATVRAILKDRKSVV